MKIQARYPGKCIVCGARFPAGLTIEWSKGKKARHTDCIPAPAGVSSRLPRRRETLLGWPTADAYEADRERRQHVAEYEAEAAQERRDEAAYQQGVAEMREAQAFAPAGSALREQMYLEMEMAAYNRGDE